MGSSCTALLLVAGLGLAAEPAPAQSEPVTDPTTTAPDPAPATTRDEAAARDRRLALRDPFEGPPSAVRYRSLSPDLLDPFVRPASTAPITRPKDLRDPFVDPAPRRCISELHGVPVQRPRQLERGGAPCPVIDKPLRNPFAPPTSSMPVQAG